VKGLDNQMDDATLRAALAALTEENAARAAKLETLRGAGANAKAPLLDKKQLAALTKDYGRCVCVMFGLCVWGRGALSVERLVCSSHKAIEPPPPPTRTRSTGCGRCGWSGSGW
jgi:hypothetical protein